MALGKTVGALSEEITERELREWMAFDRIEPFGPARADLGFGIVASVIANVNRGKKTKTFTARDFMPYAKVEDERQRLRRHNDSRDWKAWRAGVSDIFKGAEKRQK